MKIYNTQKEIEKDIVDGCLKVNDDIKITFDCLINADISALDISARDISALNISARNISALDISARNIVADDINYYAFCIAYYSFKCKSIVGSRRYCIHKCLDGDIEIVTPKRIITIDDKKIELSEESYQNLKSQLS